MSAEESIPALERALEEYHKHWQLGLDLNQSAELRDAHRAAAACAAAIILELAD